MIADLARLTWTFLWLSVICVGGGLGAVPEMQRQVVERWHWVTAREFVDGYALSQLTPGPNMLVSVFVGYRAHGLVGALLAGTAMFLPAGLLTAVVARQWEGLRRWRWAAAAQRALTPIGIGLMASGVYALARTGIHDGPTALIALLAGLALSTRRLPAMAVVLAGGVLGWVVGL